MKGKNFSCNNLGQRKKSDFYETPYSITQQLLNQNLFSKSDVILEPACGGGAIVKVLKENGYKVTSYDKDVDFLKENNCYKYLVTNPPFSLAKEFILQAKKVITDRFALLLPLSYLHGKERFDLIYSDKSFPLASVYVFTRYPLLGEALRADGKYHTGMMVYAWFVWDRSWKQEPNIHWLDNQPYVVSKVVAHGNTWSEK